MMQGGQHRRGQRRGQQQQQQQQPHHHEVEVEEVEVEQDADEEEGIEISLSPTSLEHLESRFYHNNGGGKGGKAGKYNNDADADADADAEGGGLAVTIAEGSSNSSGSIREDDGADADADDADAATDAATGTLTKKAPRSRRQRMILAILLLCGIIIIIIIIVAGVLAGLNKKGEDSSSSASRLDGSNNSNGNSSPTQAPAVDDGSSSSSSSSSSRPSAVGGGDDGGGGATSAPTLSLPSTVRSVQSIYAYGESISIFFAFGHDHVAQQGDWIGIYPAAAASNDDDDVASSTAAADLGQWETFLFLCNSQRPCSDEDSSSSPVSNNSVGQVTFSQDSVSSWPALEPGNYKAYVLRGEEAPFEVVAETDGTFEVLRNFMVHAVIPALNKIELAIRAIIIDDDNIALGAKFVRLGFHDCAGGCDGCVDLTFADNAGLDVPIDALAPIVAEHESIELGISRADIWALAALVGADIAQQRSDTKVDFSMQYLGRQNCEDRFDECFDQLDQPRECSATLGPHVHLPEPHITTEELFHFFSQEFDMGVQETVALMGAHTIGALHRTNSGFDGPNGWVRDNLLLDNDYYHELVGGSDEGASEDDLINLAPPWLRFEIDNSDLEDIPDRGAWRAFPPAFDGSGTVEILMLNADIALVRELTEDNLDLTTGRVNCAFTDALAADQEFVPRCPHASQSLQFAADYKFDNDLWLHDFEAVYHKMLNHGYDWDPSDSCLGGICVFGQSSSSSSSSSQQPQQRTR